VDDRRQEWLSRVGEPGAHDEIVRDLGLLREVDVRPAPAPVELGGWMRVAAWNLERGRWPAEMADVIRATGAQVVLVSEADVGMARSSNADVPAALGSSLGMGSAFAVEFVELGLGGPEEVAAVEAAGGGSNDRGLHGNAILSTAELRDARAVRIELRGDWFSSEREPRVGGRVAVLASVTLDGVPVTFGSVHLESASDPDDRAAQFAAVLAEVPDGPAIVGGDLNTFGASFAEIADRPTLRRLREADPSRFAWPVPYEPLFEVARDAGFDWLDANVAGPTTRHEADGAPHHHPLHIDWLFTRGLEARRATVVPAVGPTGRRLSDHQLIAASVRLAR
jgi:endonuclease/exonuclease/phosphatase family metal-dependent hydrolase